VTLDYLGFACALGSMILFGLYMVPRKLCRLRDFDFLLSMAIGIALFAGLGWGVTVPWRAVSPPVAGVAWALAAGPIWCLGMLFYTFSVTEMGLTLSTPIKNTTAVMGTLIGILVFAEWRDTQPVLCVVGSLLIVACAWALAQTGDQAPERTALTGRGVLYALLSAAGFALYATPLRAATSTGIDVFTLLAFMAPGILLAAVVLFCFRGTGLANWRRQPLRDHAAAVAAGAIWVLATMVLTAGIERIGLAVTWSVSNLNTLVTVGIGILVFHEVDVRKHWRAIGLGLLAGCLGVLLLGLAKWHR